MSSSFWEPKYWLPRNVEWDQVPSRFSDLIYPIYFSIPILIFRILLESFFGFHIGAALGYINKNKVNTHIWNHLTGGFAKYTRSKRVLECMFRFICYTFLFSYGLFVLWDKPWFNDVTQCWIGYPFHEIDKSVWYVFKTLFFLKIGSLSNLNLFYGIIIDFINNNSVL